jgi:hypothetical protein
MLIDLVHIVSLMKSWSVRTDEALFEDDMVPPLCHRRRLRPSYLTHDRFRPKITVLGGRQSSEEPHITYGLLFWAVYPFSDIWAVMFVDVS